jgi:hypothetical protein
MAKLEELQQQMKAREADLNGRLGQNMESAPIIYVDGAIGFAVLNGVARLNLYQDRLTISSVKDASPAETRVIAARLVMPVETVVALYRWLGDKVPDIEQQMQAAAQAVKRPDAAGE